MADEIWFDGYVCIYLLGYEGSCEGIYWISRKLETSDVGCCRRKGQEKGGKRYIEKAGKPMVMASG